MQTHDKPAAAEPYSESNLPVFTPMPWTLAEIRASIPPHLFVRNTTKAMSYLVRDVFMAAAAWYMATWIDPLFGPNSYHWVGYNWASEVIRWMAWLVYWWFQGLIFTGLWVIGHECGHSAFSPHKLVNDGVGFIIHSLLLTPYFSWRISHHRHHKNHASMERDEVYVPKTRSDLGIPPPPPPPPNNNNNINNHNKSPNATNIDYEHYFGDTPLYTLCMLIRQQLFAFPAYLLFNVSGQKSYPPGTNHFNPNSILFTKAQRPLILLSNLGLLITPLLFLLCTTTTTTSLNNHTPPLPLLKLYFIPWLLVTHWFVMITYLHHTAPEAPHYRRQSQQVSSGTGTGSGGAWNFQRGAAATVDRDFLGWQGRFFLHWVAHYHVVHHFFPRMPFYNGQEATEHLKAFIGDHYLYSDKPVFKALWDSYNECQFVDDEGDIVFYRNKRGQACRRPAYTDT